MILFLSHALIQVCILIQGRGYPFNFTGHGIPSNGIPLLCGEIFASTKQNTPGTSGQFGIGLKAVILYCQQHLSYLESCFSISTSVQDGQVNYMELSLNCSTQEIQMLRPALYQIPCKFSGTEIRLKFPPCELSEYHEAIQKISWYFQALSYSIRSNLHVKFTYDTERFIIDRPARLAFLQDFQVEDTDVECQELSESIQVKTSAAVIVSDVKPARIDIQLLRYANDVPMFVDKAITSCVCVLSFLELKPLWVSMGYKCRLTNNPSCPVSLISTDKTVDPKAVAGVIMMLNIRSAVSIPYRDFAKSILVGSELKQLIASCLETTFLELRKSHPMLFETLKQRHQTLVRQTYVPQIVSSLLEIVHQIDDSSSQREFRDTVLHERFAESLPDAIAELLQD